MGNTTGPHQRLVPLVDGLTYANGTRFRTVRSASDCKRRLRLANSPSLSPRFVKPFFSQILLEGPFVTADRPASGSAPVSAWLAAAGSAAASQ